MNPHFTFAWVVVLSGVTHASQPAIPTLDPYTVTGSRLLPAPGGWETPRYRVDEDAIARMSPVGVTDLLRQVPGIHVDHPGARGVSEAVYLDGGEPNYTLVLVDGIRLNDSTNTRGGSGDYSLVDPWFLEQLTIARGAQSSIYGSEALNGVISMSLRPGKTEPGLEISAEAGGKGYFKAGVSGSEFFERGHVFGGASWLDEGEPIPGSTLESRRAFLGADLDLGPETLFQVTALYGDADSARFPDDSGGSRFAVLPDLETRESESIGASMRLVRGYAQHQVELRASWFDREDLTDSPGVAPGIRDPVGLAANRFDNEFQRVQIQGFGRFALQRSLDLVAGFGWARERGFSASELFFPGFTIPGTYGMDRDTWSVFAELRKEWDEQWSLALESRIDGTEGAGERWSPRLRAGWQSRSGVTQLFVDLAEGFKLPSFFALANPLVGNPELRPEQARSIQITWDQAWSDDRVNSRLSLYHYQIEDLVDFVPGPPPTLMNLSEVKITGVSLEGTARLRPGLELQAHVSTLDFDTGTGGDSLLNRPDWRGGVFLEAGPTPQLGIAAGHLWVGSRPDSSIPTGAVELPAYSLGQLTVDWFPFPRTRIRMAVDNLWDREYDEKIGFPGMGRRIRLRVSQTF